MADRTPALTVGAILMNTAGKILLQQRDDRPDLRYAGHWTTFGGRVEPGEHPDAALRRELLEEIELAPETRLWKVRQFEEPAADGSMVLIEQWLYSGHLDTPAEEIALNEGQALGFFGPDDLDMLPIAFGLKDVFKAFFAEQGP